MQPVLYAASAETIKCERVISLANPVVSVCNRYTKNKQMQKANKMAADRDGAMVAVLKWRREIGEGD